MAGTWSLLILYDPANGLTYTVGGVDVASMPPGMFDDLDISIGRMAEIMACAVERQEDGR